MMTLPHKFYPIVNDVSWIERLLPFGVKFIQYRNKKVDDKGFIREEIKRALELGKKYDAQIVINDYWDIAIEEGAEWIHLGQEDLQSADKEALKNGEIKLGTSTHNHDELDYALSFEPDYIALGPIYETISKDMVIPAQGLERITEWKQKICDVPLVAIGGITSETVGAVLDRGADSAACIGDILLHESPEDQAKKWINLTENHSTSSTSGK